MDRLGEQVAPRQLSVIAMHHAEPGDEARHRDRHRPGARDAAGIALRGGFTRRRTGAVDDRRAPAGCVEYSVEPVAAEARHHRLDHRQSQRRRDRRVDRVAAGAQCQQPGLRRQRMIGRDGAAPSDDQRPIAADVLHLVLPGFPRLKEHVAAIEAKVSQGRRSAASRAASAALMTDIVGNGSLPEQARLCPKRPARIIGTLDARQFRQISGLWSPLREGVQGCWKPAVESEQTQWITDYFKDLLAADLLQNFWTIYRAQPRIVLLPPEIRPTSCPDLQEALGSDLLFGRSRAGKEETMCEKLTGPRGSRLISAVWREPRLRYPAWRRRIAGLSFSIAGSSCSFWPAARIQGSSAMGITASDRRDRA